MNGGRLSAAEKGKQMLAIDADADLPTGLVLESAGEPAANCHASGGAGVPRHLLVVPPSGSTSEIEEAPPSPPPPPAPSSVVPHLLALSAAGPAVAGLKGRVMELQAALDSRLRELEQLRRERESEGSKDDGDKRRRRRREGADEPEQVDGAEVQVLPETMEQAVSGMVDKMLAIRLQADQMQALEEFWKPVVRPVPQRNDNSNRKAEEMRALEEFWKPVAVPRRNNSKINWKRIISLIALTSGLVPYIVSGRSYQSTTLTHIVGVIFGLWILRSTCSWCQRFRTSRTISHHVPRLIYVCFWLLVLYVLYLILRPIHGAVAGCLANISRETLMLALALHLRLGSKRQRNVFW